MKKQYIPVSEVASSLGKHKNSILKVINRLGIEKHLEKSNEARGQRITFISQDGFKRVKEHFQHVGSKNTTTHIDSESGGVFYLIQLEPECDPTRFKLGFASNINERFRSHRTSAPFCKIIRTWPCKLLWEKTAIESITRGCERVHTEIFRAESLPVLLERCEQFFSLMPSIEVD